MAETSTPFHKPDCASIRHDRIRWNLVPRLTDTRRIWKSHPPEGSSTRKSKNNPSLKLVISKTQILEDRFWRNAHWRKKQERSSSPANNTSLRLLSAERAAVVQQDFFVSSRSIRCYAGGATKGKGLWRHRPRSLMTTRNASDWSEKSFSRQAEFENCLSRKRGVIDFWDGWPLKVARNEVENASFAQRSAHRDSRIWRPELIEPAAERKRRARGRRPTFKSAYPDPHILPQCNISSNYPL